MASGSEDPPERWNFKMSPFKILGVSSANPKPSEISKAYKSQIITLHSDKRKGGNKQAKGMEEEETRRREEQSKVLTAAYNFLKHKNATQLQDLVTEFSSASGQLPKEENRDLSNVLVDKTSSERYRRLFESQLFVAKNTSLSFEDNFQRFYKKIFSMVSAQPQKDCGFTCALCEEDFIQIDHHDKLVFQPYQDYVLSGGEIGCWKYLEKLFGKEVVNWKSPDDGVGEWTEQNASKYFKGWCDWLPAYKREWDKSKKLSWVNKAHNVGLPLLTALFSEKGDDLLLAEKLCELSVNLIPHQKDIGKISCVDFLLPSFLHTFKSFQTWHQFSLKVSLQSPRLALACQFTQKILSESIEDSFYQVGEHMVKSGSNLGYAHQCFLLGSCDLNFVARKIVALSNHMDCLNLAAYYFYKTNDTKQLKLLAKDAITWKKMNAASIYHLALFRYYFFEKEDIDSAIRSMAPLLPGSKYWTFVQNFAFDFPHYAFTYKSVAVAEAAIDKVLGKLDCGNNLDNVLGELLDDNSGKDCLPVTSGALHILHEENKKRYSDAIAKVHTVIKRKLDTWLQEGSTKQIFGLARIPQIRQLLQDTLTFKQFLGTHAVQRQPGSTYDACLLALRGLYYYKTGQILAMTQDMFTSSMYTPLNSVTTAIGYFLAENPMIYEAILKISAKQWAQLNAYIEDYTGEPLNEQNFTQVLQPTVCLEEAKLSEVFTAKYDGVDLKALEKDILGREQFDIFGSAQKTKNSLDQPLDLAEKGYQFVDLEVICSGVTETSFCLTMATNYFLKAMRATSDDNVAQKYAFRALVLECCKGLRPYAMAAVRLPLQLTIYAIRCYQSFIFQANQHFSETLRKNKKNKDKTPFIDEENSILEIALQVHNWQTLINQRILSPILIPQLYTIAEGSLVLNFMFTLYNAMLKGKISSGLYSRNTPEYVFHIEYFNQLWAGRISPENSGYEDQIPEPALIKKLINHLEQNQANSPAEEILNQCKIEQLKIRKREAEEIQKVLEDIPLVQRIGFESTRENAMASLARFYGYNLADVEAMMKWHVIRRTSDGFLDMKNNRTLNFDGQQTYSKFCGVKFDKTGKRFEFLLQPAVPGDPTRPALFSGTDLLEIFGGKIVSAILSFEEQLLSAEAPNYLKFTTANHPFFKVMFLGKTPDETTKESICGTNFLMTLYHLDLLAKMLTTGQEVGAKYPFPFRDTATNLLKGLSTQLQAVLKPIGPRKKVQDLNNLERIHRFWFSVDEVETTIDEDASEFILRFGKGKVALNTRQMERSEDGNLEDRNENDMDPNSAEMKFVKGFNENMHLIEREFPIIQRVKELAKISECFWILHSLKDDLAKLSPDFGRLMNLKLPPVRPYSSCGSPKRKCHCCDWVPAVYHQIKVTLEQKWEYLFEKYPNFEAPDNALERNKKKVPQLLGSKHNSEQDRTQASSSGSRNPEDSGNGGKSRINMDKYDAIEVYRCYGGVNFIPKSTRVNHLIIIPGQRAFAWANAVQGGSGMGCRLPARVLLGANERFSVQNMQASSARGGSSGSPGSGNPGGGSAGDGNDGGRGRPPPPPPPPPPVKIPQNDGQVKHIFRNAPNHLRDTQENRSMLTNLASNPKTYMGTDQWGNKWHAETLPNGKQNWVSHRNGVVQEGGRNDAPRSFNPKTGLCSPFKPNQGEN